MKEIDTNFLQRIADRINEENRAYDRHLKEQIATAQSALPHIVARMLELDPSIKRIILFGSLATGSVRNTGFDIDLAVSGTRIFPLVAWSEDQELPVDIVDLDSLSPDFRNHIEETGRILYEKPQS